jgi:hypothetical protein
LQQLSLCSFLQLHLVETCFGRPTTIRSLYIELLKKDASKKKSAFEGLFPLVHVSIFNGAFPPYRIGYEVMFKAVVKSRMGVNARDLRTMVQNEVLDPGHRSCFGCSPVKSMEHLKFYIKPSRGLYAQRYVCARMASEAR